MEELEKDQGNRIRIANEFTTVYVRKVLTRNGERLEIEAVKNGLKIHLDAMQLEALTLQKPELYSKLIEQNLKGE